MDQQIRQPAYIVQVNDLLTGQFVKESGWNPSYVTMGDKQVSRINIIGTVIGIENNGAVQNIKVDDGTGTIVARSFQRLIDVSVGDVVLLVGRIREYGSERYIMPEIVNKRVDRKWGIIWKRLAIKCKEAKVVQIPVVENYVVEESVSDNGSIAKIKELDEGEGAPFEQVIKFVSEQSIKHMLMSGEVFEIRPGRLKVLD